MAKSRLTGDKQRATERETDRERESRVWVNNIEIKRQGKGEKKNCKIHKKLLVRELQLKLQLAVYMAKK